MDALEFRPYAEATTEHSLGGGACKSHPASFQRSSRDGTRPPCGVHRHSPEVKYRKGGCRHAGTSEQDIWHHNPVQNKQSCPYPPPPPPPPPAPEGDLRLRNAVHDAQHSRHRHEGQRQPAAGPGWASPARKKRKRKNNNKQEGKNNHSVVDSSQQQGHRQFVGSQRQDQGGLNPRYQGRGDRNRYKADDYQRDSRRPDSHRMERWNPRQNVQHSSVQRHNPNVQPRPHKPALAATTAPVSKNPFLSKMKQRPSGCRFSVQQETPELHGLSSDEASEGDTIEDDAACEPRTTGGPEGEPEIQDQEAAESQPADVGACQAQPPPTCASACECAEPSTVRQSCTQACATAEPQAQQQEPAQLPQIPLAMRIRTLQSAYAHAMAAEELNSSALCTSNLEAQNPRTTSSAAAAEQSALQMRTRFSIESGGIAKKKQRNVQPGVTKNGPKVGCGGQASSCPHTAHSKTKRKRIHSEANGACKAPPTQRVFASKAATAPKKRPFQDLERQKDSADSECIAVAQEVKSTSAMPEPLQWGSLPPSGTDTPSVAAPPVIDTNAAVSGDDRLHSDEATGACANTAACSHSSDHPPLSAASLLERWMIQDPPDKSGNLLHAWCTMPTAGAASNCVQQAENISSEQQEGSVDADRHNTDAHAAEQATESAKPSCAASSVNETVGGAQKRRFHPVGRGGKRPSIHLAFQSNDQSMSGVHSTNTGGHEQQHDLTQSAGVEAKAAKPCAPDIPNTAGIAIDNVSSIEPQTEASELPNTASGQQEQPKVNARSASSQQPDAATLNIMLQNLAKHGADGSTAQVPTRLLQSMAKCMDTLLQQQVRHEEPTPDVRSFQNTPDGVVQPHALHSSERNMQTNSNLPAEDEEDVRAEQCAAAPLGDPDCGVQGPDEVPTHDSACDSAPAAEGSVPVHVSQHDAPEAGLCTGHTSRAAAQAVEAEEAQDQEQDDARARVEPGPDAEGKDPEASTVLMERHRNVEVEQMEWARRQAELEKQRRAAQAERRAQAERNAVERARAQRQKEQSEMEQRTALRSELQIELGRLVLPGMKLRQALVALGFHPGAGSAGERAALKQARVFHHPDSSRRRGCTLRQQIMSEEIFKLLGSLA